MTQAASFSSESHSREELIAGSSPRHSRKVTLLSGENRARGSVLGRTATAGTIEAAAAPGNTGNATIGSLSVGGAAKEGVYKVVCVEPATNAGALVVEDPDGVIVGRATVGVAFDGAIGFTVTDGAADLAAGDYYTVTVSNVAYKYLLSAADATDGSQVPEVVLAADCDASAADAEAMVYTTGDFNEGALIFGTGHTADTVRTGLRARGIRLLSATQAA